MKKNILLMSKLLALLVVSSFLMLSCKEDEPNKPTPPPSTENNIVIEGITVGSSHDNEDDKQLFAGSASGMIEFEKLLVPDKIKDVTAYLKNQENTELKFDALTDDMKGYLIGQADYSAPKHLHLAVPANQQAGKYDLYFTVTDTKDQSKELVLKDIEIKAPPFSLELETVHFSSVQGANDEKLKIGADGYLTISNAKCTVEGAKFKGIAVWLWNKEVGAFLVAEIKDQVVDLTEISEPTEFLLKVPTEYTNKAGDKISILAGEYDAFVVFEDDKGSEFEYEFEIELIKE